MPPYDPGIRLHVDAALAPGAAVPLTAEQAHYLKNVMRRKAGDAVKLFNGRDGEWRAEIAELGKKGGAVAAAERLRPQTREPDLWLCFAPIKRARLDYVAQKASELGVSGIQPVMTRYTDVSRVNTARLRANAVEAAEQCARLSVPQVFEPAALGALLDGWDEARRILLCDESRTGESIVEALQRRAGDPAGPWAVFVGPEGGYAPEELDALHNLPFVTPVGLGERLLRADTAAVAALACWQAVLGDWR